MGEQANVIPQGPREGREHFKEDTVGDGTPSNSRFQTHAGGQWEGSDNVSPDRVLTVRSRHCSKHLPRIL